MSRELARASGIDPDREQLLLSLILAIVVAVALKVVGIILIAAMLVIPAAAARPQARTPEAMAAIAIALAIFATVGGLQMSLWADTPTGPSIVTVAFALFVVSLLVASAREARR